MTSSKSRDSENISIGLANSEIVNRYGSANAEFLKGLRGYDYEKGQSLNRGLQGVTKSKINPEYSDQNIKQQAGYSAEIVKASNDNAENIISGNENRTYRTEDVPGYGSNNTISDHVSLDGSGNPIDHSQMKFVKNPKQLLNKIAGGAGGGKNDLSRYMQNDFIDLPTEQVEIAKKYAAEQAENYSAQAKRALEDGKPKLAQQLQKKADNFKKIEGKIRDSGLSTEEATDYRLNPKWETTKDIASVSHRAGIEGAKFGAAIGGTISVVTNVVALSKGDKNIKEAALDTITSTGKAAGVGYATSVAGAAIKGSMQQSSSASVRALSNSALPSLIVSTCIQLSSSVNQYANGEIDEEALFHATAMTATSVMASTAGATLGQIAVPVPVVGAMVGGMIGHTVSMVFYQSYMSAMNEAKLSHERYLFIREKCEAAKALNQVYLQELTYLLSKKVNLAKEQRDLILTGLSQLEEISSDEFAMKANFFAESLGCSLPIKTQKRFDEFMSSDFTLKI